jgi:hypothetical protein
MNTNILDIRPKKAILGVVAAILLLIILSIGAYFYWINFKKPATQNVLENDSNTAEDITNSAIKGVLPSIQTNPLEDKPDINPADKANPFKEDIKINPF